MFRSASMPEGPNRQAQPVTESPRLVGFVFWLAWVVANALGFGALWIASGAMGEASKGPELGGLWAQLVISVIIGATVGIMQALVLRWRFSRSALWALAAAAGMSAGLGVYIFLAYFMPITLSSAGEIGLAVQTAIWIAQGFVLAGSFPRAALWALANIVGYAMGSYGGIQAGFAAGYRYGIGTGVMVGFTAGGMMVGAVT